MADLLSPQSPISDIYQSENPCTQLLYHLIQFDRSRVTGPPDLSKCHTCHRSQSPLTKPPGETQKKSKKNLGFLAKAL
jgi:hypothetical protein